MLTRLPFAKRVLLAHLERHRDADSSSSLKRGRDHRADAGCSTCSSVLSTRPVAASIQTRPCANRSLPASPRIIAGDVTSL